jgi:hypothetical protein
VYVAERVIFARRNECPVVAALVNFWGAQALRMCSPKNENDNAVTFCATIVLP